MLDIRNLTFSYSKRRPPVVSDVSLTIEAGGVYGLLGANGVGKTTLLNLAAGMLTPQSGSVTLLGNVTRRRLPATLREISYVAEEPGLPERLSVNKFAEINAPFYPRFSAEAMARNIERFDIDGSQRMDSMSMGQRKKALICFALACNTKLLLMDEPTNGLDITGKSAFRRAVLESMTDERAMVVSTHQVHDVEQLLDHVVIMNHNGIVLNASTAEITALLAFHEDAPTADAGDALWQQPSPRGRSTVSLNPTGEETQINLETLFGLSQENPAMLKQLFTNSNTPES